ncbi:hypothetical protein FA10DRAFT_293806 [Acaromyces ingoldii]|uniref:Uncharacterized protein n=1 Tax=Acaromyces ingoldii TaxID=215250 RepID=A0A316YMA5_9BASI|nr:hypothetical protein FA10DRAFT_293806 [Acaromyces ingoldii]PWN90196.1 hypothetical protein FA10DRAFT_293806 [Acaromyces ingoldii]
MASKDSVSKGDSRTQMNMDGTEHHARKRLPASADDSTNRKRQRSVSISSEAHQGRQASLKMSEEISEKEKGPVRFDEALSKELPLAMNVAAHSQASGTAAIRDVARADAEPLVPSKRDDDSKHLEFPDRDSSIWTCDYGRPDASTQIQGHRHNNPHINVYVAFADLPPYKDVLANGYRYRVADPFSVIYRLSNPLPRARNGRELFEKIEDFSFRYTGVLRQQYIEFLSSAPTFSPFSPAERITLVRDTHFGVKYDRRLKTYRAIIFLPETIHSKTAEFGLHFKPVIDSCSATVESVGSAISAHYITVRVAFHMHHMAPGDFALRLDQALGPRASVLNVWQRRVYGMGNSCDQASASGEYKVLVELIEDDGCPAHNVVQSAEELPRWIRLEQDEVELQYLHRRAYCTYCRSRSGPANYHVREDCDFAACATSLGPNINDAFAQACKPHYP